MRQACVSFMQATPAGWRLLLEAGFSGAPSFTALSGGEPLAADLAQALLERCGSVYNGYGPTETTVYSTMWRVADSEHGISIGRPLANTRVDIRDAQGELCLPGASGELWIGGAGVSEGYLRRPELTDERFVTADCANGQSMRFYRTGDRARWLANGTLQHLGRLDFQIKVRGYRIEPGEIEAQLLSVAGVARAIVVAREDRPGDTRLVAYYVVETSQNVTAADLRARLREALPEYMLPQHLVALEALPLLPNLKVDRKALPAPGALAGAAVIASAPRDDLERSVYAAMAQVLSNPKFSIQDNFFDLGGHSLLAAQLTSKLNRDLGLNVPFLALFEAPSCAALAAWIRTSAACADPQISRRRCIPMCADRSRAPLSMMQQRIYFLEALHPGRVVYNTPSAHRLFGKFDEHAFEQAWREIIRRQPILRTAIVAEGEFAVQLIHAELPFSIFPVEDFSALAPAERELRLALALDQFISEPFNLAHAPLFRVRMFKLGEEEHVMAFLAHHMIWDGGSFDLLFQELSALYAAYCLGQPSPLPELTRTYADFSVWQHDYMQGAELSAQLQHWTQRLQGALSPLELPLDRPRPPRMSGRAGNVRLRLDATLTDRARTLGRRADATLFMVLLTTYAVLLQRLTGQRDLIIATPVRGRDAEALDGIMGFFVNALPLRITLDPAHSFLQALSAVRASVLDGFTHPDVPLDHLVRALKLPRDESRTPIYQAFFAFQDARAHSLNWHELRQERIDLLPSGAAQDIGLWFVEAADGLFGGLNFNADIFDHTTIERHGERFMGLLIEALLAPEKAIARLPAVTPAELAQLQAWNQTAAPYQRELGMHGRFELQAARAPHATALYCAGQLTRYGELDAAANRIAHALIARGVGPGQRVGLCLARDQRLVAGLLGVLKTGAAYVPLDPDFPTARVNYMLADAAISQLISVAEFADLLDFPAEHTLRLDVDADALATQPTSRPALPINPDAPAYVIHTSGSTGQPKGVVVPHSALSNFLEAMQQKIGLRSSDRLLAVTTLSFDIAVLELLLPLSAGAQVVMASRETAMDGHALLELLDVSEATLMQATPASWRMLLEAGWTGARDFRVLCGGEALPPELASLLRTRCSEIYNLYGPTETTIWSTCWRVDRPEQGISIGTPIANTEVWVVDEFGELCAPGVPGELLIGGIGVTQGYFERPELSTERFVADRFRGGDSARLYRTGDRGRWLARGRLEHLGRLDHQVKVRGHRIELGEVESTIGMQPGIARVVVTAREDQPGDVRLVAYLKPQAGAKVDQAQLRKTLRQTLPDYMVPQHFVVLDEFPSLPNGKIDRAGLPAPQMVPSAALEHRRAAASPTERQLAALWAELLGADVIGADDNFFDLGGHSLLAMQAIARMFTTTGKRVNPRCYIFQTLAQIAQSYLETPAPVEPPGVLNRLMGMLRGTARSGNG